MIDTILHDRYQVRELLTQKAGRRTFLALDLESQNLVILKIIRFNSDFQWDDLKLFEREATTLRNLYHPAIPRYLDYFETTDGFALVQTYINAPSLENLIRSGRKFSESEVVELADQLLNILSYLHNQLPPVIHRDLKPSNILLSNRSGNSIGDVYLVDFGSIQTAASTDGGTITVVGSYGYTPPEQFYGQTTTASDLYSLGMTLIYLITGNHPAQLVSVNGKIQFDRSNLSSKLARWLEKITEYSLDRRFNCTQLAQTALTSSDRSCGNFLNLKPTNSQVELYYNLDQLELKLNDEYTETVWPNRLSARLEDLSFFINSATFACFILFVISHNVLALAYLIFSVFISHAVNEFMVKYLESITYFTCEIMSFDRASKMLKFGTYSEKTEAKKWSKQLEDEVQIDFLVYQPSYTFTNYFDTVSNQEKAGLAFTTPKLSICRGGHQYFISEYRLSDAELHWIGQELSDFLNLELQIIYPTPTISPAQLDVTNYSSYGC
jgi:serine/threonine protein kinase